MDDGCTLRDGVYHGDGTGRFRGVAESQKDATTTGPGQSFMRVKNMEIFVV